MAKPRASVLLVASTALFAGACSPAEEPPPGGVHRLALTSPAELARSSEEAQAFEQLEAPSGWSRVVQPIEPGNWVPGPWPGTYQTSVELPGAGMPPDRESAHELRGPAGELIAVSLSGGVPDLSELAPGSFSLIAGYLFLFDPDHELVSQQLEYIAWIERNRGWSGRVHASGATGDGFSLLAGERLELSLPALGPGMLLRFGLVGSGAGEDAMTLAVTQDGVSRLRARVEPSLGLNFEPYLLELDGSETSQLALEVQGGHGQVLVLDPTLSAAQAETSARPDEPAPDVVIFMADTLRADNLGPWGAAPDRTPNMNAFAARSQVFVNSHSPSSWTLPAQSSLLSGVYPYQHGLMGERHSLSESLTTMGETFQAAGYRTIAITDGVFVSARYGLDQGFELFLEDDPVKGRTFSTLEWVQKVLDLDDGRPLFLYVQTYRAHTPYTVSPEVLAAHPELFGADPDPADWDYDLLAAQGLELEDGWFDDSETRARLSRQLEALYRGGVIELDRGFGEFEELLAGRGLGDAILLFTSDHGEAFGEHDAWIHGNSVYEEEVRIPFILSAPGLEPGVQQRMASLIDIGPTLVALAGLEPPPAWVGQNLVGEPAPADLKLSFEAPLRTKHNPTESFAVYRAGRKVIGTMLDDLPIHEVVQAFDLDADPLERIDLGTEDLVWPSELLEQAWPDLEQATEPVAVPDDLNLSTEELERLRAMGYIGDL